MALTAHICRQVERKTISVVQLECQLAVETGRGAAFVAYVLYLVSIPSAGILALVGVILAYAARDAAQRLVDLAVQHQRLARHARVALDGELARHQGLGAVEVEGDRLEVHGHTLASSERRAPMIES